MSGGNVMTKSFVNEWLEVIRPLFLTDAIIELKGEEYDGSVVDTNRIEPFEGGDVIFEIRWKLENNQNRPNKRSRSIRIIIEEEAIDDCVDFKIAGLKLKEIIKIKLSTFNPDDGPPTEEWKISTDDLT